MKILNVFGIFLLSLPLTLIAQDTGKDASFFPVLCWDPLHGNDNQYAERLNGLESIKACHFSLAGFVHTRDIPECEKLGLKAFTFGDSDTITKRQWNDLWDDDSMSDKEIEGRKLKVNEAKPMEDRPPRRDFNQRKRF